MLAGFWAGRLAPFIATMQETRVAGGGCRLAIGNLRRGTIRDRSQSFGELLGASKPKAWEEFVDQFMGLVIHVVNHSAQARSMRLSNEDREDLAADVFLTLVKDDFAVLRHFRGESSLATYAHRRNAPDRGASALKKKVPSPTETGATPPLPHHLDGHSDAIEATAKSRRSAALLDELDGSEAEVVRMYHLEEKLPGNQFARGHSGEQHRANAFTGEAKDARVRRRWLKPVARDEGRVTTGYGFLFSDPSAIANGPANVTSWDPARGCAGTRSGMSATLRLCGRFEKRNP